MRDGDFDAYIAGYERLRQRVIEAARNVVVARMLDSIYEKTNVVIRRIIILPGARRGRACASIAPSLAAMRRGDASEAERLKRQNLRSAKETPEALPDLRACERSHGADHVDRACSRSADRHARAGDGLDGRRPVLRPLLADFGAEVIKIEPADGDPVRTMGKQLRRPVALCSQHLPQQAADLGRPAPARGPRHRARARAQLRRGGGELQARHAGGLGPRLGATCRGSTRAS